MVAKKSETGIRLKDKYLNEVVPALEKEFGPDWMTVAQELGVPLYLGPFLDELNLKYQDISLELLDDSRYSIEEGLRSGEVDIYFASVMRDFEIPGLTKTTVTASSQYLLLPRSHRLANRTTVSLRELDGSALYPTPAPGKTAFVISSSATSKPPG